jgi:Family of unknown function (DUF5691)
VTTWPELLSTALVGTDRRPVLAPEPGVETDEALTLLDAAAAWSVYRRAGAPPVSDVDRPSPAPPEPWPVAVPAATARLAALAGAGGPYDGGTRAALLTQWLELAAAHAQRVPPEFLPDLFELSRYQTGVRPLIRAAGGTRVPWLAAQNPDWARLFPAGPDAAAVPEPDDRDWQQGSRSRRRAYLVTRRRSDPAAALALLEADWSTMDPDERLNLIDVLADGLGPGDEPFLERALADRRADVRRRAADLLGALPGSAFNRRMTERARACVRVEDGRVTVSPPARRDAAMERDGVIDPPAGAPRRAWWLSEILARTPLSAIADEAPAQFLARPVADEWRPVLHRALTQAALRQHDPQWAAALVDVVQDPALATALYPVLGPEELIRRALAALTGPALDWVAALERCPAPWPEELATAALAAWERAATLAEPAGAAATLAARQLTRSLDRLSRLAGLAMAPALAADAVAGVRRLQDAAAPEARLDPLAWVASVLNFRHQMAQEIQETA